jgi:hypothetical protein
MTLSIRPAKRSSAKPIICFHSLSGDGKTCTALLLARGFVGDSGKIVMIETEGGRGEGFVDEVIKDASGVDQEIGKYDVISIRDDFSPAVHGEAIQLAEKSGADALIIDTGSHEWEGTGGVLEMAIENEKAGKRAMLVWQQPKLDHNRKFVRRLFQTPIPLVIVNLRSRYPMEQQNKKWVRSTTLVPYQSEDFLFEMFIQGYLDKEHKVHVQKYTVPSIEKVIPNGQVITIESGKNLRAWADNSIESEKPQSPPHPIEDIYAGIKGSENKVQLDSKQGKWDKIKHLYTEEEQTEVDNRFTAKENSWEA